jgi:hypothetical protein
VLLPRFLAHLKPEISEKKWDGARRWVGSRASARKYKMSREQRPHKTVAGSSKRLATWFYQMKTGHCPTGPYLQWTRNLPTAQCWWCPYRTQTREHIFKNCPEWKLQQQVLRAEVRRETGRGKNWFKIRDLLTDDRCSQAVPDFLSTTDVGRLVPVEENEQSETSEWELRERREMEEERRKAEELGAVGEELSLFLPTPPFMASTAEE